MFNEIKYDGIGAVVAVCHMEEEVQKETLVKMAGDSTVAPCQQGDKFCGLAMKARGGLAPVQFKGFMTVPYSKSLPMGWNDVACDAYGGITATEGGVPVLVVSNHGNGTVTICL